MHKMQATVVSLVIAVGLLSGGALASGVTTGMPSTPGDPGDMNGVDCTVEDLAQSCPSGMPVSPEEALLLTATASVNFDGCGANFGGFAFWTRHFQPIPEGFGSSTFIFDSVNGTSTGLLRRDPVTGTARLTGRLVAGFCHGIFKKQRLLCEVFDREKFLDLDLWLVNRTSSPIFDSNLCVDGDMWLHFDLDPTRDSTLTGPTGSEYAGLTIVLALVRDAFYGVHFGFGASQKNAAFGLSAWLDFRTVLFGPSWTGPQISFEGLEQDGDLNINLHPTCKCPVPPDGPPDFDQCDPEGDGLCCLPNGTFAPSTFICRPVLSGNDCDVAEFCTGTSATCPEDEFKPSTEPCPGRIGFCDVFVSATCPGDGPECPRGPRFDDNSLGGTWFQNYQVISFDDFVADTGDVEGRVAVKNNFSVGFGFSIGAEICTGFGAPCCDIVQKFNLIVGRDAFWGSGRLLPDADRQKSKCNSPTECAFVGGDATGGVGSPLPERVCATCFLDDGCKDDEFESARAYFMSLSASLAQGDTNVFSQLQPSIGGIVLTCQDSGASRYTVSIAPEDISAATWWTLVNCNFMAEWIINIDARDTNTVVFQGGELFGTIKERTIYNILGDPVVKVLTQVNGNLLMPNATLRQTGGVIIGNVVAGDIQDVNQINKVNCSEFTDVDIITKKVFFGKFEKGEDCVPPYVMFVQAHGQFIPGDVVRIGDDGKVEEARIGRLLDVNGAPAIEFTTPLKFEHEASTSIKMTIANPLDAERKPAKPESVGSFPCTEAVSAASALAPFAAALFAAAFAACE